MWSDVCGTKGPYHNKSPLKTASLNRQYKRMDLRWDLGKPLFPLFQEYSIREASVSDFPKLSEIAVEAYLPEWTWWVNSVGGIERARAELCAYFHDFLEHPMKRIFITEESTAIVGFVGANAAVNPGTLGYGVAVLPEFRRKGRGTALLAKALSWLRGTGVTEARLEEGTVSPLDQDTPAVRLYLKLGARVISEQHFTLP